MTRRQITFKDKDTFFVSQEFNGDKTEAANHGLTGQIQTDWPRIPPIFDGVTTLDQFREAVLLAETLYGYEPVPLDEQDELPPVEEVWLMSNGTLLLTERYGRDMVQCLAGLVEEYGFKAAVKEQFQSFTHGLIRSPALTIRAKNTDGHWTDWFTIVPDFKGQRLFSGSNTDQCNIWLYDTRPDLTPDRCVAFFNELNRILGLFEDDRVKLSSWIDPEDWQEIAGVRDAYRDPRYTEKKES